MKDNDDWRQEYLEMKVHDQKSKQAITTRCKKFESKLVFTGDVYRLQEEERNQRSRTTKLPIIIQRI